MKNAEYTKHVWEKRGREWNQDGDTLIIKGGRVGESQDGEMYTGKVRRESE